MTATREHAEAGARAVKAQPASLHYTKPATDAAALRDILHGQDNALALLNNFASNDMPGRQEEIQLTVDQVMAAIGGAEHGTVEHGAVEHGA